MMFLSMIRTNGTGVPKVGLKNPYYSDYHYVRSDNVLGMAEEETVTSKAYVFSPF
jgi:hypothetical protein